MEKTITKTVDTALQYYKKHRRCFPWRETQEPYHILVSEIMLQQTQADRVIPKYLAFLRKFPTIQKLARASRHTVLQLWSGLGYNRRAIALHETAKAVTAVWGGKLPSNETELIRLPGIGEYTANALRAFAFNKDATMIETNIRTVVLHHILTGKEVNDKQIREVVEKMYTHARTKRTSPRVFYSALMDYGAHLKTLGVKTNHRSKHYTKQSTFTGSVRQTRGELVRLFLKHKTMSAGKLETMNLQHTQKALTALVADGIIRQSAQTYTLAD